MNRKHTKIFSLVMAIVLLLTVSPVAFAENYEEYPTVYVVGAHKNDIINTDGEIIYPIEADVSAIVKEALIPCFEKLALGMVTDDFTEYVEEINSRMAPIYEELILDKDGNVSNGTYTRWQSHTYNIKGKKENYGVRDANFWYDWRESPIKTAGELKNYIDDVLEATDKEKVELIGRCYGANVIAAYLELYKEHAIECVADVSYYSSSILGVDFAGALFSGEINLEDKAITNFLNYYVENGNLFEDDSVGELVSVLAEILQQVRVLGLTGEALTDFVNRFKEDLFPVLIRSSYGGWLSYWSMVPAEYYEQSIDFIFNTPELKTEYKEFIDKADMYYEQVQLNAYKTMEKLSKAGINFYIFAKYNFPEIPLYKGATTQGDANTSVLRQSFGATAADYDSVLSKEYLSAVSENNLKYISPDKKIDVSTCLFPDTTWFVKDLHHDFFSPLESMSVEIMRYDLTGDSSKYPQFLTHTGENVTGGIVDELVPTQGVDEDYSKLETNMFTSLVRFIKVILTLFSKILSGTIVLK